MCIRDRVEVARFFMSFTQRESCGKCVPCREGTKRMLEILERIVAGKGEMSDLDELEELANMVQSMALCGLGKSAPLSLIHISIRKIGEKGRCIIVGRNADSILKEYDHSLHVFIYGDYHWRLNRMQEKMPDVPREKLSEQLVAIDKARKKYCAYFTGREFGVADSYDICLNAVSYTHLNRGARGECGLCNFEISPRKYFIKRNKNLKKRRKNLWVFRVAPVLNL